MDNTITQKTMSTNTTRLVQLTHPFGRCIALVSEPNLVLIDNFHSVYELTLAAIDSVTPIKKLIEQNLTANKIDYNEVYQGNSEWKLMPAFDHPQNSLSCIVSGTGL